MADVKHPLRQQFEVERRRAAFLSFLAGSGIGIIATDTWVSHWFGVAGGLAVGTLAYGAVYLYETWMWGRTNAEG